MNKQHSEGAPGEERMLNQGEKGIRDRGNSIKQAKGTRVQGAFGENQSIDMQERMAGGETGKELTKYFVEDAM